MPFSFISAYMSASCFFAAFDFLASPVLLVDAEMRICFANSAAENLFARTGRSLVGQPLRESFGHETPDPGLENALAAALRNDWSFTAQNLVIRRQTQEIVHVNCSVSR